MIDFKNETCQLSQQSTFKALDLRENFIKFFRQNNHKLLPASKVFNDDKSLLFINAGMNQLKSEFLKEKDDNTREDKFRRLCNSQICIRAGGKHNDLDDVGMDSYHLTSFEMLGNWSINSYQKEDAIRLAFTYLTEHLGLNKTKMYVTYFKGDANEHIGPDLETKSMWLKYLPEERIVEGNFKDNFWMMAETGPCGMCTEIHYDMSDHDRTVPNLVNKDDPTLIEIWNIVFIQFNRMNNNNYSKNENSYSYEKLPRFFVDTGMGLERLCAVLQKKSSIYKTDVFHYLMGYAQAMSNCGHQYSDCYDKSHDNYYIDCAYRIFCDHFRTLVIALFDGVDFDCAGRGNVLRKIFRRLLTYLYLYLNDGVVEQMMTRPIVLGIISDILNYYLKRIHNEFNIRDKLISEERLFLGCLQNFQRKLTHILELNEKDGCFDYVCKLRDPKCLNTVNTMFNGDINHLKEVENLYDKLFSEGIPSLLVTHCRKLKIKHLK